MKLDGAFVFAPTAQVPEATLATTKVQGGSEEIVVRAGQSNRDAEWRAELSARVPQYEASNSDAAQPLVPYAAYTSPEQERLTSLRDEALGICGTLGGYVQCPNKAR